MSLPVFLDPQLPALAAGAQYELTGSEAHHAVAVRRLKSGTELHVVDGAGLRLHGTITHTTQKPASATITVKSCQREMPPQVQITLVQALATGGRDELAIEMATELGAMRIIPWHAKRCTATWPAKKAARRRERWQAVVTAATKQSRRSYLPEVTELHTTAELCELAKTTTLIILDANGEQRLADMALPAGPLAVVIGPEGGISERELADLVAAGGTTARFGGHILRTSTAAATAVGLIAARSAAWGEPLQ